MLMEPTLLQSLEDLPTLPFWRTHATRTAVNFGSWLSVELHSVQPKTESDTIDDWAFVHTPNFINVALVTPDFCFPVFWQNKYAPNRSLKRHSIAPVGGYINSGEEPLSAAKREALEELGYVSDDWLLLSTAVPDANRGLGVGFLFAAFNARYVGTTESDDIEEQYPYLLTEKLLEEALMTDRIACHSWIATFSLALLHARKRMHSNTLV